MSITEQVLKYMNAHLGDKYSQAMRWGKGYYDCSSLVYRAYAENGFILYHKDTGGQVTTSREEVYAKGFTLIYPESYSKIGQTHIKSSAQLKSLGLRPGDHIFYSKYVGTGQKLTISHIATVNNDGGIIHARNPQKGVCKDAIDYWYQAVVAVIRYGTNTGGTSFGSSSGAGTSGNALTSAAENKKQYDLSNITSTAVYTIGELEQPETPILLNYSVTGLNAQYELMIQHENMLYAPVLSGDITWNTERKGTPGKLEFTVVQDDILKTAEGDPVRFVVNGNKVFFGYIFKRKPGKDGTLAITAYDQLRYLKNKESYVYRAKRADEVVRMIAADFRLNVGEIENTEYVIPSRVEDGQTLFDIIQEALDLTLENRKKIYVLYDDFGALTLKNMENMQVNLLVDQDTAQDFDYSSSIDGETYNKIKLSYVNQDTGRREIYIAQDGKTINKWGTLQYYESADNNTGLKNKAQSLLALYNSPERTLKITGCLGDVRVRGGSSVFVKMALPDMELKNMMLVEKVTHKFSDNQHTMDLTVRGGGVVA